MSNPEMKGARILRFHTSDKVFHSINAICWYALVITGAIGWAIFPMKPPTS